MGLARTILVVDDDAAIRMLCRLNLELDGYRVVEAATVDAARGTIESEPVDAVLLDVHVGGDNGLVFLAELKQTKPDLGVAMLTGDTARAELTAAGADAVIGKPFSLEELHSTVAELARRAG